MPEFKSTTGSENTLIVVPYPTTRTSLRVGVRFGSDAGPNDYRGVHIDGPALRDALLEAFPLEEKKTTAAKPEIVPGTVWRSQVGHTYAALPGDKVYALGGGFSEPGVLNWRGIPRNATVVFDPRDAVALHNPLAKFRIGDTATKVKDGVTTSFKVRHIDHAGFIGPNSDYLFNPRDFSSDRERLGRLPAGTITRAVYDHGYLCLRTEDGFIRLDDGSSQGELESDALESNIRRASHEVIYLP